MGPNRVTRALMGLAWPAFLAACLLELAVFALVDPSDLQWRARPLGWSRMGVYSAGFFVFWAICGVGCALTALLLGTGDRERPGAVE